MKIMIEFHTSDGYSFYARRDGKTISYGVPDQTPLVDAIEEALYGTFLLYPVDSENWFDELCKTGKCFFQWDYADDPVLVTRLGRNYLRVDDCSQVDD